MPAFGTGCPVCKGCVDPSNVGGPKPNTARSRAVTGKIKHPKQASLIGSDSVEDPLPLHWSDAPEAGEGKGWVSRPIFLNDSKLYTPLFAPAALHHVQLLSSL